MVRLLVVDDDEDILEVVRVALSGPGREVEVRRDAQAALALAGQEPFDVVVTDVDLKSNISGLDLLRAFKAGAPATQVILMSGFGSLDNAVEGVRSGAFEYISKPFDIREVMATVNRALDARAPAATIDLSASPIPAGLLGRSRVMLEVYKQIALAADSATPVLVIGESGTGKELVARAIHDYGKGAARPFVAVNCAALAETLLESELFGHVRGAFTGAIADKKGLFEQASGGTIFLDEIGETTPGLQVKLLRVLQEGELRPVGGTRSVKVNARVLAATNRDLHQEVAAKRFRQDLYYRLSAFIIHLPALRDRRDDIPLLLGQFVRNASARARRDVQLTHPALEQLTAHDWPGNVRELENVVERLVIGSRTGRVDRADVNAVVRSDTARLDEAFAGLPSLDELERRYLLHVLEIARGNRTRAAAILKVDRKTLYRMAARFGVPLGKGQPGGDEAPPQD